MLIYLHFPKGVTLQQLLNHTSGIHSYTDKPEFMGKVSKPVTPADLSASFRDDPPDFAPGAGFHDDNSGCFLLGEIVAKASAKPFAACLQEMFCGPLGRKDTGIYHNATPPYWIPAEPKYGTSASGMRIDPSGCWHCSNSAT